MTHLFASTICGVLISMAVPANAQIWMQSTTSEDLRAEQLSDRAARLRQPLLADVIDETGTIRRAPRTAALQSTQTPLAKPTLPATTSPSEQSDAR